jgi:hypothetical protein
MTASTRTISSVLALAVCALGMGALHAQERAGSAPSSPAAPVSILPTDVPVSEDAAAQEPAIAVGDLAAPGIDRIGLVDMADGGFSPQLWSGTDLELLKHILPQLPRRMISPAQRRLAQNLLLSPSLPPAARTPETEVAAAEGDPVAAPALTPSQWLLETRLAALTGMGEWGDVAALLELVPPDQMTESLRRIRADANLVINQINAACAEAQTALNASPDPHWQKIQVFCQLAIDQPSAATLGLALLREQRIEDPVFFWAAEMMQGARPPAPDGITQLEPLHLAMLRKANAPLPAALLKVSDPTAVGILAAIHPPEPAADKADKTPAAVRAERRRQADEARLLLAERGVALGTVDAAVVRSLYGAVNAKTPAPPPLSQITAGDLRGRALLFQAAQAQTVPTARAEVIALAIDLTRADRGDKGPDLTVVGRIYEPLLMEMEPTADLVWFAGSAARGLLAAGAADKAKVWLDLAANMARTSSEAGLVADGLLPITRLLHGDGPMAPQALNAWAKTIPAEAAPAKRAVFLNLLLAVGDPVNASDWLPTMSEPPMIENARLPAPYLWNGLAIAAREKHVGEGVVLSLVALGDDGAARAAPAAAQHVIETLRAVGRENDARAIAVETALAQGL